MIDKNDNLLHSLPPIVREDNAPRRAPRRSVLRRLLEYVPRRIRSRLGVAAKSPDREDTPSDFNKEAMKLPEVLFHDTDTIRWGGNVCRTLYGQGEPLRVPECRYPILFVLQGRLELHFGQVHQQLCAHQMSVIDTAAITRSRCAEATVVVEFHPPERLLYFLEHCSVVFRDPCSDVIPLLPPLEAWINTLSTEHLRGEEWTQEFRHTQCKELTAILLDYPQGALERLHAAFSICALGHCERCQNEDKGIPGVKPQQ